MEDVEGLSTFREVIKHSDGDAFSSFDITDPGIRWERKMADYKPLLEDQVKTYKRMAVIYGCALAFCILVGLSCTVCSYCFFTFSSNENLMKMGPLFIMTGVSSFPLAGFLQHSIKKSTASSLLKLHDTYDPQTMKGLVETFLK